MILPITLVTAAACAVINLWLALRLVRGRLKGKVLMGDGGDPAIIAGMRAHANFVEYAPFVLILIGVIELAGGSPFWLQIAAAAFVLARIAHPIGMVRGGAIPFRSIGIVVTWVVLALLAGWAIAIAYQGTAVEVVTFEQVVEGQPAPVR